MSKNLKKLLIIAILSRFFILLTSYIFSDRILHFDSLSQFITTFVTRWDGHSYLFLAKNGYVNTGIEAGFIVFLPLYPFLIRLLSIISNNTEVNSFWTSNFFFLLSVITYYKLLLIDFSSNKSLIIALLLIVFPTSYFFSSGFPESVFMLTSCLAFYFMRLNKFFLSGIFALSASLTRPFGFLLWPSILIEVLLNKKDRFINLFTIISIASIAVVSYLGLNYILFNNPFEFNNYLKTIWGKSLNFPWVGIIDSWKRGITTINQFEYKYFVGYGEAITATLAWILIPLGFIKKFKIRTSYLIYYILGVIISTSTGFLLSVPRYLLSLPPFFIILASVLNKKWQQMVFIMMSVPLLLFLSYKFSLGHWTF